MRALATAPPASHGGPAPAPAEPPPVEYGEACRRYLAGAALSPPSQRVYRISLASWAWPLVGEPAPAGRARRRAVPPLVPLAVLDDPGSTGRLAAAITDRAALTDSRTVNREVSALRSAVTWWRERRWLRTDPASGLRHLAAAPPRLTPLSAGEATRLFRAAPGLREHAFWRVLRDSGAGADDVLRLDIGDLDLGRHRARLRTAGGRAVSPAAATWIGWREDTSLLLRWLVVGRAAGPVFLTSRRARPGSDPAHVCPITGRARMSYRRAAEIFTGVTRPLDPAGQGWTLQQLHPTGS